MALARILRRQCQPGQKIRCSDEIFGEFLGKYLAGEVLEAQPSQSEIRGLLQERGIFKRQSMLISSCLHSSYLSQTPHMVSVANKFCHTEKFKNEKDGILPVEKNMMRYAC